MEKQHKVGKTALIYCRIGADQVQDGTGFVLQESVCVQYALSLGYVTYRVTKEVGSVMKLRDRPLLSCDLADLHRHIFDALIAYSPDRLSRDPRQIAQLALECEQAGVALLFATAHWDEAGEDRPGKLIDIIMRQAQQPIRQRIKK